MNVSKLNKLVESSKLNKSQIASKCGISAQSLYNILSGADTRVSTLESLLSVLGAKMTDLYDDQATSSAIASGDNSVAAVNSEVNGNKALEDKVQLLEQLLKEKERTIQILMQK